MVSYRILLKLSISINVKFQKTKTEALVVINLFFRKYIYLTMSPSYFHQSDQFYSSICTTFMLSYFIEFFLDICFCLWLCCCFAVVSVLFSFVFISAQHFSSTSKDGAVTTADVELNIRTIVVLLLLTLKTISPINFFRAVLN